MDFSVIVDQAKQLLALYGLKIVAALAIFVIGSWVARRVKKLVVSLMTRSKTDPTLVGFTANIAHVAFMAFIVLAALNQLGIQTTSFVAIIGAAGLAIALSLQGSLSNFAAGFLMIAFRPFKVGDFIEGAGVAGTVVEISIFTTTLKTGDNKKIIVPNAKISEDNIINYSANETRRVDLLVGVSYEAALPHVKQVLEDIIKAESRVLAEPEYLIAVSELADNSVNLVVRAWVKTSDYWPVHFALTETIKNRFDEEGIGIPYPQRDIHVYEHKTES